MASFRNSGILYHGVTNTAGVIIVSGPGQIVNTGSSGVTVIDGLRNEGATARAVWNTEIAEHNIEGTMGRAIGGLDYDGRLWIDTTGGGTPGSVTNVNGTRDNPVDNLADLDLLRVATGYNKIDLTGSLVLTSPQPNTHWVNQNPSATLVINGQDISNSLFSRITLTGDAVGSTNIFAEECNLANFLNWQGVALRSVLVGTVSLVAGGTNTTTFAACLAGSNVPIIDLQGAALSVLTLAQYLGRVEIQNSTTPGLITSVDLNGGAVVYGATNTAGLLIISGFGRGEDQGKGAGFTVLDSAVINLNSIADTVWDELIADHAVVGSVGEALTAAESIDAETIVQSLIGNSSLSSCRASCSGTGL